MKLSFIKRADVIITAVLLIIALVLLFPKYLNKSDTLSAEIIKDGVVIETVDLSKVESSYTIDLDDVIILVENNAISFIEADCPDKLCVKCGKLKRSGDTAACVPTKTVIRVMGIEDEIDAVSY